MQIRDVQGRQIFDSRGVPTVEARVTLKDGTVGVGSAPSGASTGKHEARELRDGGEAYCGRGVRRAVENVNGCIRDALIGVDASRQRNVDNAMRELDESEDRSNVGANAMIAVSWAAADAAARSADMELFQWIGGIGAQRLPCPMFNVVNGGKHAGNNLEIQEFMLVPVGADSFHEAMRMGTECYQALRELLSEAGLATSVGDEGGFAPNLERDAAALEFLLRAIERAGWRPEEDVCLALDAAASEWAEGEGYRHSKSGKYLSREEMIAHWRDLAEQFPLISMEDPLGEEDFDGFRSLTDALGGDMMIVGDDLFTTNVQRLRRGMRVGAANAILVKPNQIGTLSETFEAMLAARDGGYGTIVSHRSGETLSGVIADLAVGMSAEFIKAGAPARGERLAKYNRLMEIEDMLCGE